MVIAAAKAHVHEPQYKGLGELHDKYNGQGFEVLAFPCEFTMCANSPCTESSIQCSSQHANSRVHAHYYHRSTDAGC
jgi:glutathione peroxidase-family protein